MNFQSYSKYYDLLYKDKSYEEESKYICKLIKSYHPDTNDILELGCGSGNHARFLTNYGFNVTGIERSIPMVEEAKKKQIERFFPLVGNISDFQIPQTFDVAISLFHVISYLSDNKQLLECFSCTNKHLRPEGVFIFDCWFTPAIYHQGTERRVKEWENDEIAVKRIAHSIMDVYQNVVNVHYNICVTDKQSGNEEVLNEVHPMRHFSIPEIELAAHQSGFVLLHTEAYLTKEQPSIDTWGVCFILRKI